MPKATWGLDENEPEELNSGPIYKGEKPPPQYYRVKVDFLAVKLNSSADKMISGRVLIDEPEGSSKAQFNGYPIWVNQNVTDKGAPFLKKFINAFGISWSDFNNKTVLEEGKIEQTKGIGVRIVKLGGKPVDKLPLAGVVTKDNLYEGKVSLSPQSATWTSLDEDSEVSSSDDENGAEADLF